MGLSINPPFHYKLCPWSHGFYLFFFALTLSSALHALYNGNPALTESIEEGLFFSKDCNYSMKVGAQCDYVLDRKLEAKARPKGNSTFYHSSKSRHADLEHAGPD